MKLNTNLKTKNYKCPMNNLIINWVDDKIEFLPCCRVKNNGKFTYTIDQLKKNLDIYLDRFLNQDYYIKDIFDISYCPNCSDNTVVNKCYAYHNKNSIDCIDISLVTKCNYSCKMCQIDKKEQNVSYELTKNILKNMKKYPDITNLVMSGCGEISLVLNDELLDIISETHIKSIFLITNGYIDMTDLILKYPNLNIKTIVSLHTTNQDKYKEICGIDGYNKCIKSLQNYYTNGILNCINSVIIDESSINNIDDIISFRNECFPGIKLNFLINFHNLLLRDKLLSNKNIKQKLVDNKCYVDNYLVQ